jgi:hypothetical protein
VSARQDGELLAQQEALGDEVGTGGERRAEEGDEQVKTLTHAWHQVASRAFVARLDFSTRQPPTHPLTPDRRM